MSPLLRSLSHEGEAVIPSTEALLRLTPFNPTSAYNWLRRNLSHVGKPCIADQAVRAHRNPMTAITASRTVESSLHDIEKSRGAVPSVASRLGNGTHWIYGAGGFGRRLARLLTEMGGRVAGFIDQAKPGAELDSLAVMAPDQFTPGNTDTLLIGVFNPAHSWAGPMAYSPRSIWSMCSQASPPSGWRPRQSCAKIYRRF
jgi:hypothetical protein